MPGGRNSKHFKRSKTTTLLFRDDATLDYLWRNAPLKLQSISAPTHCTDMAVYSYSVVANSVANVPALPPPKDLLPTPFYIRWHNCMAYTDELVWSHDEVTSMAEALKEASLQCWKQLCKSHGTRGTSRVASSLWCCFCSSQKEQPSPQTCDLEVGLLYNFHQARPWNNFQIAYDFIFLEVCGADGLWRCALRAPQSTTDGELDHESCITEAFKDYGYNSIVDEIGVNFWQELRVTKCKVATALATPGDYSDAVQAAEGKSRREGSYYESV